MKVSTILPLVAVSTATTPATTKAPTPAAVADGIPYADSFSYICKDFGAILDPNLPPETKAFKANRWVVANVIKCVNLPN